MKKLWGRLAMEARLCSPLHNWAPLRGRSLKTMATELKCHRIKATAHHIKLRARRCVKAQARLDHLPSSSFVKSVDGALLSGIGRANEMVGVSSHMRWAITHSNARALTSADDAPMRASGAAYQLK